MTVSRGGCGIRTFRAGLALQGSEGQPAYILHHPLSSCRGIQEWKVVGNSVRPTTDTFGFSATTVTLGPVTPISGTVKSVCGVIWHKKSELVSCAYSCSVLVCEVSSRFCGTSACRGGCQGKLSSAPEVLPPALRFWLLIYKQVRHLFFGFRTQ